VLLRMGPQVRFYRCPVSGSKRGTKNNPAQSHIGVDLRGEIVVRKTFSRR